jgi:hypothetical protein
MGNISKLSKIKTVVEVDQSGKFEDTKFDTVLAYSNGFAHTIIVPKRTKREAILILRKLGKTGTTFYLQLFTICLYLLIKNRLNDLTTIIIDEEYVARNRDIKRQLLNLINKIKPDYESENINFRRIGKESPAHNLAINCLRRKIRADKVIKLQEILELILSKSEIKKIGGSLRR